MAASPPSLGVNLPERESASTLLLRLLREAAAAFPGGLGGVAIPRDGAELKKRLAELLLDLEQARLAAADPVAIARWTSEATLSALRFVPADDEPRPLSALTADEPLVWSTHGATASAGWRPEAPLGDEVHAGRALEGVVEALVVRRQVSPAMAVTLRRAIARLGPGERLDLSGERFALLGAGAEIAPTRPLLEAGATVLWTDIVPPPEDLREGAGVLLEPSEPVDLLRFPERALATVLRFAEEGPPIHLGLFAYGPGKGREWRLGAAMNAIARALPPERLRSVGLYVSPTTPSPLAPEDAATRLGRLERLPWPQRSLQSLGLLRPNRSHADRPPVADTVVPIQGVSYQAAQWIEKSLAAEALAAERPGLRVSANVAPVTETRSLEHPVFKVAFRGAPMLGVSAFPPAFTRTLSALAYIEDVTGPEPPGPAPRQLHGGLFTLPYSLESAIRVAAARGVVGRARLETR